MANSIKYLFFLLPLLWVSSPAEAQLGSMCQGQYVQCEQRNNSRLRSDQNFCRSSAFNNSENLRQNCLDKAFYDYQRRAIRCDSNFRQCWWVYEEEDSFSPFPRGF